MPRTSSQTLYYWQADVGMFDDPKIVDLNDEYGPLGEVIFFRILDYIARTDGYFAQLNDALIVYLYRSVGSKWVKNKRIISEVIQFCGVCGLFDVNLLTQNVITSQGIQRRWLYAKKKDRARGFSTAKYWLLGEISTVPMHGRAHKNSNSCGNNTDNCNNNAESCNNNALYKKRQENIPPVSPRGEGESAREWFFSAYPKLKGLEKYQGIDYEELYRRFAESEVLRSRYSSKWVYEHYSDILSGEWTDNGVLRQNMRKREEVYARRRGYAEDRAEHYRAIARSDARFKENEEALRSAELLLAKKEVAGADVRAEREQLQQLRAARAEILARLGLTEDMLVPQYRCRKCNDTGYLPDGTLCDCGEENEI